MINIRYFAKYRECMGCGAEQLDVDCILLDDLLMLLRDKSPKSLKIIEDPRCLVAVNREVVQGNIQLKSGDEVAFFPPVTGG